MEAHFRVITCGLLCLICRRPCVGTSGTGNVGSCCLLPLQMPQIQILREGVVEGFLQWHPHVLGPALDLFGKFEFLRGESSWLLSVRSSPRPPCRGRRGRGPQVHLSLSGSRYLSVR